MSSGSRRNRWSAWTRTCQVRPNLLKSLTYDEPKRGLERAEDRVERHAQALGLHPVDLGVDHRNAGAEACLQAREPGLAVAVADHLVDQSAGALSSPCRPDLRSASENRPRRPGPRWPAAETQTRAPREPAGNRVSIFFKISDWLRPGRPVRSDHGLKVMYIAAALGATAPSRIDMPPIKNQLSTPGTCLEDGAQLLDDGSGRALRRRVGKLDADDRIALVFVGEKARRQPHEPPAGEDAQPGEEHEHEAGVPDSPPDQARCRPTRTDRRRR